MESSQKNRCTFDTNKVLCNVVLNVFMKYRIGDRFD